MYNYAKIKTPHLSPVYAEIINPQRMINTEAPLNSENTCVSPVESKRDIEHHKKTADHLLAAAVNHFKAINHIEEGNYKKAAQCTALAKESMRLANEAKQEDIGHHALSDVITI